MKKIYLAMVMSLLLIQLVPVYGLNTNFEITEYHMDVKVNDDNTYNITETIDVKFNVERHGIIRVIPLGTSTGGRAKVSEISVNNQFAKSLQGNEIQLKIGDSDIFAPEYETYVIKYLYQVGSDGMDNMDEFYFNLIGTEWDVNIREASFSIVMPFEFDESKLNFTSGGYGSTLNTEVNVEVEGKRITGHMKGELGPLEGVTVALFLPEGYYINAEEVYTDYGTIAVNWFGFFMVGLLTLGGIIVLLFGRNRKIYPAITFYPPKDLTPADVGYIYDGSVNPQDVTSLIIYWAEKRFLIMEEIPHPNKKKAPQILLHKVKDADSSFKPYEEKMFRTLFTGYGDGNSVNINELKKKLYISINTVERALIKEWHETKETRIYSKTTSIVKVVINLLSVIVGIVMFSALLKKYEGAVMAEDLLVITIGSIICMLPIWSFGRFIARYKSIIPSMRFKAAFKAGLLLMTSVVWIGVASHLSGGYIIGVLGCVICLFISVLSAKIKKRTKVGDKIVEEVKGFKEFILYAEKERINMLYDENPEYFFDILPYAIVLGITEKWADKFKDISLPKPGWYMIPYGDNRYYDSYRYANNLQMTTREIASYSRYAPRSNGYGGGVSSSSGGSVGGGSGGGGGSDW